MTAAEFIPVYVLAAIIIFLLADVAIAVSRTKRSDLNRDPDFIEAYIRRKKNALNSSASGMSAGIYLMLLIVIPLGVCLLFWLGLNKPIPAVICSVLSLGLPEVIYRLTKKQQAKNFEERYARALKALASDIESGLSIQQSVEEITQNPYVHDSIRKGFRQIDADIKIGIPIQKAFYTFAVENDSEDAYDVAAAIAMQNDVGGNEGAVIEAIIGNIRDRIMMRKEITTMFTDITVLAAAMDVFPYLIVGAFYFFAPAMIAPFFESTPKTILFVILILIMLFGSRYIHNRINTAKRGQL